MFEDVKEVKTPEEESQFHYYYSREKRLENAPQLVKDNYAGKMKPPSAFKALFGNRANRFVIISLVAVLAFTWLSNGISRNKNKGSVNNLNAELQAFEFEDQIYVSLKLNESKKAKQSAAPKQAKQVHTYFVFFANYEETEMVWSEEASLEYISGEQYLRTKTQGCDIMMVNALVDVDGETKKLSTKVKR